MAKCSKIEGKEIKSDVDQINFVFFTNSSFVTVTL